MSKDLQEIKNLLELHPARAGYKCVFAHTNGEMRLLGHVVSKNDAEGLAHFFHIPLKGVWTVAVEQRIFYMVM